MPEFRSFRDQSRHYFQRDHDAVPTGPIATAAAWRGENMRTQQEDWLVHLTSDQLGEIESATDQALLSGQDMSAVSKHTFALPQLSRVIAGWRQDILHGRGFVVVRGLPVDDWGAQKSAFAYWGLGHHLGIPGAQNPQNELLGHVVDYGEESDNPMVRRYRTTGNIDFHCDAADVVGLLCLHTAKSGGQSRIVSSGAIYNEIQAQRPDLIGRLFEPMALDLRGEERPGDPGFILLPPCCYTDGNGLSTFYHSEYFRSAARHDGVAHDQAISELLDLYDSLCLRPELQLDMWLEPGDMQFISNHTTVHSRTAYEDWPERTRKRHLLRLWLSL